jgi:RNA polymerase sigma-70 factor (ECF subfamily)
MGTRVADDRELWERICGGDSRAFESFYHDVAPRLQNFLRHLLPAAQVAEDVTQETFLQMWRRPNGFRPERGSLRAYAFGIGRKRAADWWRHHPPENQPERLKASKDSAETNSLISDIFERLGVEQKSLLWLREVEGLSYSELSEVLQIPPGTVKSRLFAAREELRRIWRDGKHTGGKFNEM